MMLAARTAMELALIWYYVIGFWLVCPLLAYAIGRPKGLALDGFIYGLFTGPAAILIVLLKSPTIKAQLDREQRIKAERDKRAAAHH